MVLRVGRVLHETNQVMPRHGIHRPFSAPRYSEFWRSNQKWTNPVLAPNFGYLSSPQDSNRPVDRQRCSWNQKQPGPFVCSAPMTPGLHLVYAQASPSKSESVIIPATPVVPAVAAGSASCHFVQIPADLQRTAARSVAFRPPRRPRPITADTGNLWFSDVTINKQESGRLLI